jgi:hypothetical protein
MRRLARLNLAQRIVVVVALAALLRAFRDWLVIQLTSPEAGWFEYAPLSAEVFPNGSFPRGGWRGIAMALVWIVLTALWAAISIWLFGLASTPEDDAGSG